MVFFVLAVLIVTAWILAARMSSIWTWVLAFGGATLLMSQATLGAAGTAVVGIAALISVGLLICAITPIRQALLTRPAFAMVRRALPAISKTEQDALDAGTVWFDGELFSGDPNFKRLLDLDTQTLTDEEQAFIDGPVEELCAMCNEWEISYERKDLPPKAWDFIKSSGMLGMIIPKEYGGLEFSALAHSQIVMKIASRSTTAGVSVMVPNSLGPAELLLRYGTDAQRGHYLPRLASGEDLPCFALTNPYAGSDAAAIPDHGVVCYGMHEGEEVLGIRVSWDKRYITLAPVATVIGLAFQLSDPDHLIGDQADVGITLALIPATHPGVESGRRHYPARQAFMNGPTRGNDVFIPMSFVIGGQDRCGDGWRMLMNCLAAGRSISLPANGIAALKFCTRNTGAYARIRQQFGISISNFEGIEERIAQIVGDTYAIDAARIVTAASLDAGEEPAVISGMLKYQATERMRAGINHAMDVHGGRAICDGPNNYLMGPYSAIPVGITVEGANILTRSLIVFGQGSVRAHPWLLKEIQAAQQTDYRKGFAAFDEAFGGHVKFFVGNVARALFRNVTFGAIADDPSVGVTNYWFGQVGRASANFCVVADMALMLLGGALKRKEFLSGRFADVFSELFILSATLKHFEDQGRQAADEPILEYVMLTGFHNLYKNLDEILNNFPSATAGFLLRRIVFPFGNRHKLPSDRLTHQVAQLACSPGASRDRLTGGIYINKNAEDITGRLEVAFTRAVACEDAAKRVRKMAQDAEYGRSSESLLEQALEEGLITRDEADLIRARNALLPSIIDVDEFAPGELAQTNVVSYQTATAA